MALTSVEQVAEYLGRELTGAQNAQLEALLPAVEAWITSRTGRTWGDDTPITGETHTLTGPLLWLTHAPVASVQSVSVRPPATVGATSTTLVATADYELLGPAHGLLVLSPGYAGWRVTVAYTPALPLDSRIALAATMLAAAWARPTLDGVSGDVKQYTIGQELSVTFRDPADGTVRGVPDDVVALVDSCGRRAPVFA